MRCATDEDFQTAIIFCLENPEMPFIFSFGGGRAYRLIPKADSCSHEPMSASGHKPTWRPLGPCPICPKSGQTQRRSVCPLSADRRHSDASQCSLIRLPRRRAPIASAAR
jgi:hypothetical protein